MSRFGRAHFRLDVAIAGCRRGTADDTLWSTDRGSRAGLGSTDHLGDHARSTWARAECECVHSRAADYGWGFLELPGDALDPGDALTAEGIATTVATLTAHRPQLVCGRDGQVSLADERQRNRGGCLYGCPARRR